METATASLSEAWFLLRQFSVSATGLYKAAGMSRMISVVHFWWHLVFNPQDKNEDSPIMAHGRNHEDDAVAAKQEITNNMVIESPYRRHPDIYWLGATPDGLVVRDVFRNGMPALVECKCPFWIPYDTPPFEYLVQMFAQMATYMIPCNYLVCWYRGRCRRIWRVHWNDAFWYYVFIRACIFWKCVEMRVSPEYIIKNTGVACEEFARTGFDERKRAAIAREQGLLPWDLPPPVHIEKIHWEVFTPEMKPTDEELGDYRMWIQTNMENTKAENERIRQGESE